MTNLPDIAIIGPGKVGTCIAVLAQKHGYKISAIGSRDKKKAEAALNYIDTKICSPTDATRSAQLVLLTVADGAIASLCTELAQDKAFKPGQIVAHLSGALSSEVLSSAQECGAKVASLHPLQMFPTVEEALVTMPGTHWFYEGDGEALKVIEQLIEKIGGIGHKIKPENKALYHCAVVMASNYLNVLMDVALTVGEEAGLDRKTAWQAFLPIVEASISNITNLGTVNALTGPIARDDQETVKLHLKELAKCDPEIKQIYRTLGKWAVRIAKQKNKPQDENKLLNSLDI